MKKVVSLVLAAVMALAMIAGAAAEDAVQQEPARFVIRSNSNKENKTENDKIKALIEEKSGIDFEVIVVAENTWAEKVNVMIAGSEKFDTLNLTANSGVWSTYAANGAIVPYTQEMLDTYLPNVMAMIPEEAWIPCKDAEGNIWALPRHESFTAGGVPSIRTDWLEKLNMEMPTTLPELEAYFEGVKTQDVNGNGDPNDEYGYIPYFQSLWNGPLHVYYLGTKGNCDNEDRYLTEDGTVMPWYMHENAWALVAKGAEWYQKGYINQDYLTMTNETANDMGATDRIGMCSGWYNMGLQGTSRLMEANPDSSCSWAAIPNFTDAPSGVSAWGGNPTYMAEVALSATSTDRSGRSSCSTGSTLPRRTTCSRPTASRATTTSSARTARRLPSRTARPTATCWSISCSSGTTTTSTRSPTSPRTTGAPIPPGRCASRSTRASRRPEL